MGVLIGLCGCLIVGGSSLPGEVSGLSRVTRTGLTTSVTHAPSKEGYTERAKTVHIGSVGSCPWISMFSSVIN